MVLGLFIIRKKRNKQNRDANTEVVEDNPMYGYGKTADAIEVTDHNKYYFVGGDDEYDTAEINDYNEYYGHAEHGDE